MLTIRAFFAGVTGALVLTIVTALARAMGIPLDLETYLGSLFTDRPGTFGTWLLGFAAHLVVGGVLGVIYGAILARTRRASPVTGALLGLVHAVISGVLLAVIPVIHPSVPERLPVPGMMMLSLGIAAALLFVALHVFFGLMMSLLAVPRRWVIDDHVHA